MTSFLEISDYNKFVFHGLGRIIAGDLNIVEEFKIREVMKFEIKYNLPPNHSLASITYGFDFIERNALKLLNLRIT